MVNGPASQFPPPVSPAHQRRPPGKAASHRLEQHQIAAFDASILHGDIERERNRGGGRVSVAVDSRHDLLGRDAELVRGAVDDALVGLMRHEPVEIVGRIARVVKHILDHIGDRADGETEDGCSR